MDICSFGRAILGLTTAMSNPEEVAPRTSLIVFPKTKPGPESFLTTTLTHLRASTVRPAASNGSDNQPRTEVIVPTDTWKRTA
jgi:hypothetical protein